MAFQSRPSHPRPTAGAQGSAGAPCPHHPRSPARPPPHCSAAPRGLPTPQPHPTRPSFHRLCWVPNLVHHRATGTLSVLHARRVFTVKLLVFQTRPPVPRLCSHLPVGSFYANGVAPGSQASGLGCQPGAPRDFSEGPHMQRDPTELWALPSAAPEASRLVHGTHALSCSGRSSRRHLGLLLPVRPSPGNVHMCPRLGRCPVREGAEHPALA